MLNELFYNLLRVSIGTQDCFTRTPSEDEWSKLYVMAEKQSLLGICFVGLQQLRASNEFGKFNNLGTGFEETYEKIGMSEGLYYTWMGMAAQIQHRNVVVNQQCLEVQRLFRDKGVRSCIIKGQGSGSLYKKEHTDGCDEKIDTDLSLYRQSGDIDVWVEGGRKKVLELVNSILPSNEIRETHAQLHIFKDTDVEVHYRPGLIRDFIRNRRLQAFFDEHSDECFTHKVQLYSEEIVAPTIQFNAVQQLLHIYHHLFSSGIGLRQVMDYYFVLKHLSADSKSDVMKVLRSVGVKRFIHALMYVEQHVFGMDVQYLLCKPSVADGKYLLSEIMRTGNFGYFDKCGKHKKKGDLFS